MLFAAAPLLDPADPYGRKWCSTSTEIRGPLGRVLAEDALKWREQSGRGYSCRQRRFLGHAPGTTPLVAKCDHVPRGALARDRRPASRPMHCRAAFASKLSTSGPVVAFPQPGGYLFELVPAERGCLPSHSVRRYPENAFQIDP